MAEGRPLHRARAAPWLNGEVKRHCIRCEADVDRDDSVCPKCGLPLRKECPRCHYWAEMDSTFCIVCRHGFPLPPLDKATVKMWHILD
ncbi:MAG TPA: zinc ribbon domain-containing protein [Methanomassiliicoccales archaeon]|nr:zinc ribbon domain-containing protein [Methanomassiliicoccales archaeon]